MPATDAPLKEREREVPEARSIASYKCEDCGKIIGAPGDGAAPKCCGADMRKIR
jgi:hypothetical protein